MKFDVLDVGCGETPKGDVNVDIYPIKCPGNNFLIAMADYLPFKDKSFNTVRSS